jgi:hypothetical protein
VLDDEEQIKLKLISSATKILELIDGKKEKWSFDFDPFLKAWANSMKAFTTMMWDVGCVLRGVDLFYNSEVWVRYAWVVRADVLSHSYKFPIPNFQSLIQMKISQPSTMNHLPITNSALCPLIIIESTRNLNHHCS